MSECPEPASTVCLAPSNITLADRTTIYSMRRRHVQDTRRKAQRVLCLVLICKRSNNGVYCVSDEVATLYFTSRMGCGPRTHVGECFKEGFEFSTNKGRSSPFYTVLQVQPRKGTTRRNLCPTFSPHAFSNSIANSCGQVSPFSFLITTNFNDIGIPSLYRFPAVAMSWLTSRRTNVSTVCCATSLDSVGPEQSRIRMLSRVL